MRWGAVVLAAVCLVAGGCSDDEKPTGLVEGVLLDPVGDATASGPGAAEGPSARVDIEAVLVRATEDKLRVKVITFGPGDFEVVRERVIVELWDDGEPPRRVLRFDSRDPNDVMKCVDDKLPICNRPFKSARAEWGGGSVLLEVARNELPAITDQTRWRVQRVYERSSGFVLSATDTVAEVPSMLDRSVAFIEREDAGASGIDSATVVVQANGRLRLIVDDAPAGAATVRVFRAAEDEPIATFGLAPFRQGEDVDQEVGQAGMPEIPPLWEVEIETPFGRTRRVPAHRW